MSSSPPEMSIANKMYIPKSSDNSSSDEEEVVSIAGKKVDIQNSETANIEQPEIKIGSKDFNVKDQPGTEGNSNTTTRYRAIYRCHNYKSSDGYLFSGIIMKNKDRRHPLLTVLVVKIFTGYTFCAS